MLGTIGCLLLALAGGAAPASASQRAALTPADTAATHDYLVATINFEETQLRNLAQSNNAMEAAAAHLAAECPEVLAGAPVSEERVQSIGQTQTQMQARAIGERQRQSRQLTDLKLELTVVLADAREQPDREAAETLLQALTPLKWSDPAITELLHLSVTVAQEELAFPEASVCDDAHAWVSSGYETLAPLSKTIATRTQVLLKSTFAAIAIATQAHLQPLPEALAHYEDASEKALSRQLQALERQLHGSSAAQAASLAHLEAALGLPAPKLPKQKPARRRVQRPAAIAHAKTAADSRFIVRAQRHRRLGRADSCTADVTIEEPSRHPESLLELLSSVSTARCLSRSHVTPEPAVRCTSGLLTVEANLLPATRSVRLLLSDGRTITSAAILVPARFGGPAGIYYQAVRGPSPIPVSLAELDAEGATVAVLKLPAVVECTKNPVKYVHDGIVALVHETPQQLPGFTIRAESYRKLGTRHFELSLENENENETPFDQRGGSAIERAIELGDGPLEPGSGPLEPGAGPFEPGAGPHRRRVFAPQASAGCEPRPYVIVYGLLKAPRDSVLALVSGTLVPLRTAAIPAHLHAGGVLAYGAFSPLPSELVVRNARGKDISVTNLSEAAANATATCEGEAEG